MKKVVVGLSGGVDSSVAAYLLKKQGYDVLGVTMCVLPKEHKALEEAMVRDARAVAERIGIPYEAVDFREPFQKHVMDYFVAEYKLGRTPNPCVMCNRYVKWEAILAYGREHGADYIATGHYARIEKLPGGRYSVRNSVTAKKDQTYVLFQLTQEQLARTLMPVGGYTKEEIRRIAEEAGIPVADKKDSQEICFIPDNDYAGFIERQQVGAQGQQACGDARGAGCGAGDCRNEAWNRPGNFVSPDGQILGQHKGIIHYTVGQRKGLGIAFGKPMFVMQIKPETGEVVIGENEDLMVTELVCDHVNFMAIPDLQPGESADVVGKIRYAHQGTAARITMQEDGRLKAEFVEPVRAVTPGQAAVFYTGEYIACGGMIV